MQIRIFGTAAAVLLAASFAFAAAPAPKKDDAPAAKKEEPKKPADPVDEVLEKFAAAGKGIKTVSAELEEVYVDEIAGDTRKRGGTVYLSREGPAGRIRIDILGARAKKPEERYIFDGSTFWKINFKAKNIQGFQQAPGTAKDVFEIGHGPFPLPIGQPREKIQNLFETKLISKPGEDPVVVQLRPKRGTEFFKAYDMFEFTGKIAEGIPTKVVSTNKSGVVKTITLKPDINDKAKIPAGAFAAPDPNAPEFQNFGFNLQPPPAAPAPLPAPGK